MIGIVDYGSGNVAAIANILTEKRLPFLLSGEAAELRRADRYILPGVGAFDPTMAELEASGLVAALNEEVIDKGKKLLGICVGMQLLAEGSDEGERAGLGFVPGRARLIDVARLNSKPQLPHMGWNAIDPKVEHPILDGIDTERGFYFLHSYEFRASAPENVMATTHFGGDFASAVWRDNVFGMQFHPEKSHSNGERLLENFARLA